MFRITCQPGPNTVRTVSRSHPVSIGGDDGRVRMLGTATQKFGVTLGGEGDGERVSATVLDVRWDQSNLGAPQSFLVQRPQAAQGEAWRLCLRRPTVGVLEDCSLEFRGVPAVLAFEPHAAVAPVGK